MSEERCETCKFWVVFDPDPAKGYCHRNSPSTEKNHNIYGVWPQVAATNWCGEYVARVSLPLAEGATNG